MKKPKAQQGMGRRTDGAPVITCTSEPIRRTLRNGMILMAFSELAQQDLNPLLIIDALERQWRRT